MSVRVTSWVWEHSHATGWERLVLLAIADEANDAGYLSGVEFGSVRRLADKAKVNRKTVMRYVMALEEIGELLVCRPEDRGAGRHNEYVVLMGRAGSDVATSRGWSPSPNGSPAGTDPAMTVSEGAPTPPDGGEAMDTASDTSDAHRGAQAAPPAAPNDLLTEAVDTDSAASADRSLPGTRPPPIGPGPVQDRSLQHGPFPSTPDPTTTSSADVALGTEPGSDDRPVDNPAEPVFIQQLRATIETGLAALDPPVTAASATWDLAPNQVLELAVHAAAWPTLTAAVEDFAAASVEAVQHYGVVPRTARAWRTPWLELNPPAPMPGEPLCTEHPNSLGQVPVRICAPCRERNAVQAIAL